jgi:RND family efflux transporter MFP subunit
MNWKNMLKIIATRWRALSLWARFAVVGFAAVVVIGGGSILRGGSAAQSTDTPFLRAVQVASVLDLENDTTPLPLIGEIKSVNEANIHSQTAGTVTHLYRKLGEYVSAGAIIAELDNASERAAVLSAQGTFEAAQANVDKTSKLFTSSKGSTLDSIKAVYSSNDDLVHTKLDVMFSNPTVQSARFVLPVSNQSLLNTVMTQRLQLESMLKAQAQRAAALTEDSDLKGEIAIAIEETRIIKKYIDDLSALLNVSISSESYSQSEINTFIATASAARTTISSSLSSLNVALQALTSAQNIGDKPTEASASEAALKQAQGALDSANANLEKTIIRAPISGTLNNLSISLGDFVSGFQQVAVVSNNGALEIVAHVSSEDRASIAVGSKVTIENKYEGAVTSIAPAIDPITKKIEVKIGFNGRAQDLTNGQSVHLDVARTAKKSTANSGTIVLPVATVKVGTTQSLVFTVNEENKLVGHVVTLGDLVGDKVQITSGVTTDMMLVTDARGLKDGQQVDVR